MGTKGGVGGEYTMEANEMEAGSRDQGGQALQEFQRCHDDMRGAIAVRRFELENDRAGPVRRSRLWPRAGRVM